MSNKTNLFSIEFPAASYRTHFTNASDFTCNFAEISSYPIYTFVGLASDEIYFEQGYFTNYSSSIALIGLQGIGNYF